MSIYKKKYCKNLNDLKKYALVGKSLKVKASIVVNNIKKTQLKIGDFTILRKNKFFCFGKGKLKIGKYCYFGDETQVDASKEIKIGNYCMFSNRIMVQDHTGHPISPKKRRKQLINLQKISTDVYDTEIKKVIIKNDVWVGMEAVILKGVTIGEGSIIAARAVVTKNVPPYSIAAGNPAKIVKKIKKD